MSNWINVKNYITLDIEEYIAFYVTSKINKESCKTSYYVVGILKQSLHPMSISGDFKTEKKARKHLTKIIKKI